MTTNCYTVYAFSFIEYGRYQQAVFYHLKIYIKIETFIQSGYKNTHLSDLHIVINS